MTSRRASYGERPYARSMHAVAFVLSLAAAGYLVYAMLHPERF
jgi:K+-transporting ATPase KdpF subunit